jgi:hypothetical protein
MTPESIEASNVAEILLGAITTLHFKKPTGAALNGDAVISLAEIRSGALPSGSAQQDAPAASSGPGNRTIESDDETVRLCQAEGKLEAAVAPSGARR